MSAVRPRQLICHGTVDAIGFIFDADLLGWDEVRRRTLSVWTPGAQVFRTASCLIVRLPSVRTVVCTQAPGLPLVRQGRLMTACPLDQDEQDALADSADGIVMVLGGKAEFLPLTAALLDDPALWLDVSGWSVAETTSLGTVPAPPVPLAEMVVFDARRQLVDLPPVAPETAALLRSLQTIPDETASDRGAGRGLSALLGIMVLPFGLLAQFLGATPQNGTQSGAMKGPSKMVRVPPQTPAERSPWKDNLQRMLARMLVLTRTGSLIGRRQAKYIDRMMKMFEQGQTLDALRHAIPLGGKAENGQPLPPYLGLPSARPNLDLHPQLGRSGGALGMPPDLMESLRSLYRDAFNRLEREGKFEEAAFVLAELLNESEEAVAFLERHGRLRLAAEMAEGRGLPPGLVVRQWWIAGEQDRAQQIARRTGAFADAVLRLERTSRSQGQVLRLAWAASLARAGQYAAAVETAWPVTEARSVTLEWLERAVALGGTAGARMLARRIALLPDRFEDARPHVLALMEDHDAAQAGARAAFAEKLIYGDASPAAMTAARAAARSILRDFGHGDWHVTPHTLKNIVEFSRDGSLHADLPGLPYTLSLMKRPEPLEMIWEAGDTGGQPLFDAAFLPDGRLLVALGEAGARMLSRSGSVVAHFDQPAHHLVVADSGDRAIVLAPRGGVSRLARLDLNSRRTEDWCEAALTTWARDYDGSLWFVAAGRDFTAIDALERRFGSLWRTPDVPGEITQIARTPRVCSFLLHSQGVTDDWGRPTEAWEDWNRWRFDLPALALRERTKVTVSPGAFLDRQRAIAPSGRIASLIMRLPREAESAVPLHAPLMAGPMALDVDGLVVVGVRFDAEERPSQCALSDQWLVAVTEDDQGLTLRLVDLDQKMTRAVLRLRGAAKANVRLTELSLTVSDDLGRLLVLDLETGRVLRDLRC